MSRFIGMRSEEVCSILRQWSMIPIERTNKIDAADWLKERFGNAFADCSIRVDDNGIQIAQKYVSVMVDSEWDWTPSGYFFVKNPIVAVEFKLRFG